MERIKQALERAEQSRLVSTSADAVLESLPNTGSAKSPTDAQPQDRAVEFHQTRIAKVDPEHLERHRIRAAGADDEIARAFDLLASRIVDRATSNGWNSIGIVSPLAGDGKSVTALNLSIRLAASAARTCLLVDLDLRQPKVAEYLGVRVESGVEDVLRGKTRIEDALFSPDVPRLSVLAVGKAMAHSGGLIDSIAAARLAEETKTRYANRIVLFDLPPVLGSGDTVHFLRHLDAVLVIAASGKTSEAALAETLNALSGHSILGCVLNCATDTISAY